MEDIQILKTELKRLGKAALLRMAFNQRERGCVLSGLCPFYFTYKGYGFCITEILGEGCQEERLRRLYPEDETPETTKKSEDTPKLPI